MTLDELKQAVSHLAPSEQTEFRAWFSKFIAARRSPTYVPTPAEQEGIERGLRDVAASRLATDEQVEAVFAEHRPKP